MPPIYRWFAPSGKSVLVYREPFWYNAEIGYGDFEFIPDFCARYGLKKTLKVYGVGDHGGGATIRDVERIIEIYGLLLLRLRNQIQKRGNAERALRAGAFLRG